jgi:hypothetical protein
MFFTDWVILSAKYGFLRPDDIVAESYNVSFIKPSAETVSIPALQQQVNQMGLDQYQEIVVLGGKDYKERATLAFGSDKKFSFPLAGCKGIGYMLEKLVHSIQSGTEINETDVISIADKEVTPTNQPPKNNKLSKESYKGKYERLYSYLYNEGSTSIQLSIVDIEEILGFKLPDSASKYAAWWANDITHSHAKAWLLAD